MQQMSYLGAAGTRRMRRTRAWAAAPPEQTVTVTDSRPVPAGIAAVGIRVTPGRCAGIPSGTLLASPLPSHPHQEGRAQGQKAAGPFRAGSLSAHWTACSRLCWATCPRSREARREGEAWRRTAGTWGCAVLLGVLGPGAVQPGTPSSEQQETESAVGATGEKGLALLAAHSSLRLHGHLPSVSACLSSSSYKDMSLYLGPPR